METKEYDSIKPKKIKSYKKNSTLFPFIIGFLLFVALCGFNTLNPSNISWIFYGDDASAMYMGWSFFRLSDFSLLFNNPFYGLELSSTIGYSGSIPILAFIFKIMHPLLPLHFQYFGFFLLGCFLFQSYFSWKLICLKTESLLIKIIFTSFLVLSPIFLNKLAGQPMFAMQFILLWSIYLYILSDKTYKNISWIIIFILSSTHPYFIIMIMPFWVSSFLRFYRLDKVNFHVVILKIILPIAILVITMWLSGYFISTENTTTIFGIGRWNLLGFFDSNQWSLFIPDLKTRLWDQTGFSYLGLGIIFLGIVSLLSIRKKRNILLNYRKHTILIFLLILLTLLAISNNVGIGNINFDNEINSTLIEYLSAFRASGRFIWPIYYIVIFLIFQQILLYKNHRKISIIILIAFIFQCIDLSPGIKKHTFDRFQHKENLYWKAKLKSPQWEVFPDYYKKIKILPLKHYDPLWKYLSYYSYEKEMKTNAALLARYKNFKDINESYKELIRLNNYEDDTLYILNDEEYINLFKINNKNMIVSEIDGLKILQRRLISKSIETELK